MVLGACLGLMGIGGVGLAQEPGKISSDEVLSGLRSFYAKTTTPDGSFRPGIDPAYKGMADTAASDLAAPTYAVILHRTFGWKLPEHDRTVQFFRSRQRKDGSFFNIGGTLDPNGAQARLYNTTQGMVAFHALGVKPAYDPLPIFEAILVRDYKTLPSYTTSFFPLAYLASGKPLPAEADRKIRALMVQEKDGYLHNHIAATFHLVHYYRLVGDKVPKGDLIVERVLRDQKADGSWLINPPARDRHATIDAVFTLVHLGQGRADCKKAIEKAAGWALCCRNPDGGFGHYPGSPSDADAVYFQVGVLVMSGLLQPATLTLQDARLLGWGHVFPRRQEK
jgi:geranylgeranyl transferase type-2 subunit beta